MTLALVALLAAKLWEVEGLVLEADRAKGTVTISHKEVPGLMPAMAMPFRVSDPKLLEGISAGSFVKFRLETGEAGSLITRIAAVTPRNQIEEDGQVVALKAPKEKVAAGALVPDFELTGQDGRPTTLRSLRGRVAAVNFLYTRCPLPEVCPRLAATFARLQKRFAGRMGKDLVLVTVTLDPGYDTPERLDSYAKLWKADPAHWRFLTGTVEQVRRAAALFGIVYWPEEGVITHTSAVGIVGRDGRMLALVEGLAFDARQLGDLIESALSY